VDELVVGRNPVREALKGNRPVNKVLLARGINPAVWQELMQLARERGVPVQPVERVAIERIARGQAHQGVAAYLAPYAYAEAEDLLKDAREPFIVVLNGIQDPHNLGAILRTADAAGVDGVVIPSRRAAPVSATVVKTSAGAVEYVRVARVNNVARALRYFKERGLWVVGAEMSGKVEYWRADLRGPICLVIGGEESGLGQVVRDECDLLVRLPMFGRVNSLNASVAGALLIYEVLRQRRTP